MNQLEPLPAYRFSPWRWWVCILLLLASTLNYMDRLTLNQTAVRIKAAFAIDDFQYSLLESVFSVAFGIGTLTLGYVVDRVGVRIVYPIAVFGWSMFGLLTGFAPGFWVLLLCRFGLGLFEAGNWPCGIRTTREVMPPEERSLGNSLFQSGTALGAIITPLIVLWAIQWADPWESSRAATATVTGTAILGGEFLAHADSWRIPFIVIGLFGIGWVLLWAFTVPRPILGSESVVTATTASPLEVSPFTAVVKDRRYWVLVAVIIGVNTSWHTFRAWLPLFLQQQQGYSFPEMTAFMTWYYIIAELGGWSVGLGTLVLVWAGLGLHTSRVVTFAICTAIVLSALALPIVDSAAIRTAILLTFGFGAFGLFPTYFTLSQELSARHQGKVTGTLGFINAIYLAGLYPVEGYVAKLSGTYDPFLALCGLPALFALLMILLFWRSPNSRQEPSPG